jgi:hypothetical protein
MTGPSMKTFGGDNGGINSALEGMRHTHRLLRTRNPSTDKVKPEHLIDDRIMQKLDESGFISRLYNAYGVK